MFLRGTPRNQNVIQATCCELYPLQKLIHNDPLVLQSLELLLHLFFQGIWNGPCFQKDRLCTFTDLNGGFILLYESITFLKQDVILSQDILYSRHLTHLENCGPIQFQFLKPVSPKQHRLFPLSHH